MCGQTLEDELGIGHATSVLAGRDGVPMIVRQRTEAGVAAFRTETRTMRLERLHGPKGGHPGPRVFLHRNGRSSGRRRWKSGSGIGESGAKAGEAWSV